MRISDWSSDVCSSDLYLARYDFLGLAPFWAECRALSDWFARVKGRPSFTKVNIDEVAPKRIAEMRSEEHTSELQSLMRISYAVFCLKKKKTTEYHITKSNTTQLHSNINKQHIHIINQ